MDGNMYYMYKITDLLNNKIYVGQSITPEKRWKQHQAYSKQEKPVQYIHRAMAKYGSDNFIFETIATCKTPEDAGEIEVILINQYDSRNPDKGYNIKPGGKVWDDKMRQYISQKIVQHYIDYPEDRKRVSEQVKIQWQNSEYAAKMKSLPHPNKMKGQSISEEQRNNIIEGVKYLKGVKRDPRSDEIKNKKISNTKQNLPEDIKREITNRITLSRGQVVLSENQKQMIINDPRSSYTLAKEYKVNASTIQRVRKNNASQT